jgi:hypothetical protein
MVWRVALGARHGRRVTLGNVGASERDTRRVAMVQTLRKRFWPTHDQGQRAQEQGTARGLALLKGATELAAMEPLGLDGRAQEQLAGLLGKALRAQRPGPMGHAHAIAPPPFDRFPWGDRLLVVGLETRVAQADTSSIVDARGNQAQVIDAFNMDGFHPRLSPAMRVLL